MHHKNICQYNLAQKIIEPHDSMPPNYHTYTGYVMFVLWCIYLVLNILFFEEPDRVGLSSSSKAQPIKSREETTTNAQSENSPLLCTQTKHGALSLDSEKYVDVMQQPDKKHSLLKSCGRNIPVIMSLVLLVLLKSVLEGLSSSAPSVSKYYFSWGVHASGIFLALLAAFVLPINVIVAYVSRRYDDRELILASLVVMFVGILVFMVNGKEYSELQFVLGGIIMFVSANSLEGPTMGLLSKTIPKRLAKGILNAGLLATEAGEF